MDLLGETPNQLGANRSCRPLPGVVKTIFWRKRVKSEPCPPKPYGLGGGVGRGLGVGANLGVGDGLAVDVGVGDTVAVAVGVDVGVGETALVAVAVDVAVAVGETELVAVAVGVGVEEAVLVAVDVGLGVGVGAPDCAQYLPPVLNLPPTPPPPQIIISLPVQTAVCKVRASGALMVLVAVQLSLPGSYLPPVLRTRGKPSSPPQTIISLPVQTAV